MLIDSPLSLDRAFSALGDSTRRAILTRLAAGEASVSELAAPFPISAPAISRHLRVLEHAGLIARRRDGKSLRCRLAPPALRAAADWLDIYRRFWNEALDNLAEHLESQELSSPERKLHARSRSRRRPR